MADWTIRLIDETGYVGIFLLMLLETIFPPIPSEVIMPIAGVRAANGPLTLWGVIASGTAGAMLGNFFWYAVARVIGVQRFRPLIERHGRWLTMDWGDIEKYLGPVSSAIIALIVAAYIWRQLTWRKRHRGEE